MLIRTISLSCVCNPHHAEHGFLWKQNWKRGGCPSCPNEDDVFQDK